MVDNYINPNTGTSRILDQVSRRVAGIFTTSTNNQGLSTISTSAFFKEEAPGYTGNLQCHVYDHNGNQLTQIGSNVDIASLSASLVEKTFTATGAQNINSTFAIGQTGYIAFKCTTGKCNIGVQDTGAGTELYFSTPQKSTSSSDPYSFSIFDSGNYLYFTGTVSFGAATTATRFPPPPITVRL